MSSFLILKENGRFFSKVTREIPFDENSFELIQAELEPNNYTDVWNGTEWIDNSIIVVPQEISRMKFEIQLYITTTIRDENNNILQFGKTFQDIIDYIDSLQMSNFYKNLLKMRLLSCVTLERDNDDLNALAPGMGISQAQLDEIFINGNSIE